MLPTRILLRVVVLLLGLPAGVGAQGAAILEAAGVFPSPEGLEDARHVVASSDGSLVYTAASSGRLAVYDWDAGADELTVVQLVSSAPSRRGRSHSVPGKNIST